MKNTILLLTMFFCLPLAVLNCQVSEDHTWKNVPIGGGGYITGMKIHPLDGEKRYYRTDVGGAYRWDPNTQRMEQMIYLTNSDLYSVAGIALHPTDPNTLYLGVGRKCSTSNTAILKSTDGGHSFSVVPIAAPGIQFHFAANGGRGCDVTSGNNIDTNAPNAKDKDREGTPMAIDPLDHSKLYIGTREKGLWILDLNNNNISQVNTNQIPSNTVQYSIRSVVFHPTANRVYIAYQGFGVFIGNTSTQQYWNLDYVGGADYSQQLEKAIDISISKDADYMLVACKKEGIMKCTNIDASVSWSLLAGGLAPADGLGYLTVDCSPISNNVAVTVTAGWNHINEFQTTTNAGANWNMVSGSVPLANNNFKWRDEAYGNNVSQIAFDPAIPSKIHFTSWFSTFTSDNWSPANGGVFHNNYSKGHEEIVPTDLIAFPSNGAGNFFLCGSGDHSGFVFDNSIENPDAFRTTHLFELCNAADQSTLNADKIKKSSSFAFCEKQSDHLAALLTNEWEGDKGALITSSDGGLTWQRKYGYTKSDAKSLIEMSSDDPTNIIALNTTKMRYSLDGGANFSDASGRTANFTNTCGIPFPLNNLGPSTLNGVKLINLSVFGAMRNITADKELPCVFYYYNRLDGTFNMSTDGGVTWGVVNNTDLPASTDIWNKNRLVSIPGHPGHLWLNFNNNSNNNNNKKLWSSVDGGRTWVDESTKGPVSVALSVTFGKGFNSNYPALYIFGTLDGDSKNYFYRSDDAGATWIRINDHAENELWGDNKIIMGGRNVPGRLYAVASGQGVIFADKVGLVSSNCNVTEKTIDGTFDTENPTSIPNWSLHQSGGAVATESINAFTKAVVDVSTAGTFDYNVQLWQDDLTMEAGKKYVIKTNLRSDSDRPLTVKLRNKSNGAITYLEKEISVSSTSQDFAFVFEAPQTDSDLRLTFMMGLAGVKVYIDDISFKEYCENENQNDIKCVDHIWLEDHILDQHHFEATEYIESNGIIENTGTYFQAGDLILLKEGFEAPVGTEFHSWIEDCP